MVQAFYDHFSCVVEHEGKHSEWFHIKSGVRQGCVMSGFLFLLVIDWTMKQTTQKKRGINWGRLEVLEDLDFADDIALLSATRTQLQAKTDYIQKIAKTTGLEINKKKSKIMCVKATNIQPITLNNEELEIVDSFTYLGSVIDTNDNATSDIRNRIKKARTAYYKLRKIWTSNQYSRNTKMKIYKSNVISVLLYRAECWKISKRDGDRLNTFNTRNLRRIFKIFWPTMVSNAELLQKANMCSITNTNKIRRWSWIGHILRMDPWNDCRIALTWTPPGKRNVGRPKET
ncbi:uncharacterized protein LOC134692200 [Mytilus trossulus]|uniref:uncharacterized protein LOC134692200 n=1 Tax=Mytilus trossulus TaxID=6551 RepID=UPI003005271F